MKAIIAGPPFGQPRFCALRQQEGPGLRPQPGADMRPAKRSGSARGASRCGLPEDALRFGRLIRGERNRHVRAGHARRECSLDADAGVGQLASHLGQRTWSVRQRDRHELELARVEARVAERPTGAGLVVGDERDVAGVTTREACEGGDVDALLGERLGDLRELTGAVLEVHDERVHGALLHVPTRTTHVMQSSGGREASSLPLEARRVAHSWDHPTMIDTTAHTIPASAGLPIPGASPWPGKRPFFGYHLPNLTFPGVESEGLFEHLAGLAAAAEGAGFDLLTVMDHFYQIGGRRLREHAKLAYPA